MIVVGGATAATIISMSLKQFLSIGGVFKVVFFEQKYDIEGLIKQIVSLAEKARKDGVLALDKELPSIQDDFLRTGLEMVVDGIETELIMQILEIKMEAASQRHEKGRSIFDTMGTYFPAFGMIGTLIGLVQMLRKLDDPSGIGPGMAVALITTFYGAVLANLVFLPIADKLKRKNEEELHYQNIIVTGILAIQAGDNPRVVEMKLRSYLKGKGGSKDGEEK